MTNPEYEVLCEFLEMPLNSAEEVLCRFAGLDRSDARGQGDEAFVYVPGKREDRVVLVAHADTAWASPFSSRKTGTSFIERSGVLYPSRPGVGLGADDRAGCTILWLLRDSGHSLLVTSGEESGNRGSVWLMDRNRDVAEEINVGHQFMVEFDRRNGRDFKCYDVGTTDFRAYVRNMTDYSEPDLSSSTDIRELCRTICGVNLSVGYRNEHSSFETLVLSDWHRTLETARSWLLAPDLPRFPLNRGQVRAS